MTTPAKKALAALDSGDISWQMWLMENDHIIRAALKVLDEVQSGRLERCHPIRDRANGVYSSGSYRVDGWNECLDHLKQIAGSDG